MRSLLDRYAILHPRASEIQGAKEMKDIYKIYIGIISVMLLILVGLAIFAIGGFDWLGESKSIIPMLLGGILGVTLVFTVYILIKY